MLNFACFYATRQALFCRGPLATHVWVATHTLRTNDLTQPANWV